MLASGTDGPLDELPSTFVVKVWEPLRAQGEQTEQIYKQRVAAFDDREAFRSDPIEGCLVHQGIRSQTVCLP